MVRAGRSGRRPLWIHKIRDRVSVNRFKKVAREMHENGEDLLHVLHGKIPPKKLVYKVTIETMEGCDDNPFEDIWVPDWMAEATGQLLEDYEHDDIVELFQGSQSDADVQNDVSIGSDEEEEFQNLCEEVEMPQEEFDEEEEDEDGWMNEEDEEEDEKHSNSSNI